MATQKIILGNVIGPKGQDGKDAENMQLSSSVTSDSEQTAATSKAVKTVNDSVTKISTIFSSDSAETRAYSPDKKYFITVRNDGISACINTDTNSVLWAFNNDGVLDNGIIPAARINGLQEIGVDQKWQDVKTLRAANVVYQNTTGKPMQVSVGITPANGVYAMNELNVDGVAVARSGRTKDYSGHRTITAIVPPNSVYAFYGISEIDIWAELR